MKTSTTYRGVKFEITCSGQYIPTTKVNPVAESPECSITNIELPQTSDKENWEDAVYYLWELQTQYVDNIDNAIEKLIKHTYSEIGTVPPNFVYHSIGCRFYAKLSLDHILPKLQQIEQTKIEQTNQHYKSFELNISKDYEITSIDILDKNALLKSIPYDEQNKIMEIE
jgi:hypothetical protein